MNRYLSIFFLFLLLIRGIPSLADGNDTIRETSQDTTQLNKKRLTAVLVTQGTLYTASMTGLYFLWYADYPQSSFHFFDDNNEWMQMDKIGHATAAYYISRIGYASYRWTGMDRKKAIWYGGLLGFAFMTNIEIFDGFSEEWGFSTGDFIANTAGCFLFIGQELGWKEQRFLLKYSFHQTIYPSYNPDLLGSNLIQEMLKDYNGMTFWLSGNISSFLPKKSKFPKWINVAFGYSAEGMTGANTNNTQGIPETTRYRQWYLSMDVDLTRIKTKSKVLKGIFSVVNFIKIPFPALEYNSLGQFKFHPLYF